jgi:hypothetical protein
MAQVAAPKRERSAGHDAPATSACGINAWVRIGSAVEVTGVARSTFGEAVQRGEVPFVVIDGVRHYHLGDLEAWVERRRTLVGNTRLEGEEAGRPG